MPYIPPVRQPMDDEEFDALFDWPWEEYMELQLSGEPVDVDDDGAAELD